MSPGATLICQGISCVLAIVVVFFRFRQIPTEGKVKLFSWELFRKITAVRCPAFCSRVFISVGNIVIQSVINSFGSSVMAGYSAAVKLNNLVITSFTTLGTAYPILQARIWGAGKLDRIRARVPGGAQAGVDPLCAACAALSLRRKLLVRLFLNDAGGTAAETEWPSCGSSRPFTSWYRPSWYRTAYCAAPE